MKVRGWPTATQHIRHRTTPKCQRDPAWHDVYKVRISTGARTLVRQNTDRIAGWLFDLQGRLLISTLRNREGEDVDIRSLRPDEGVIVQVR